MALSPELRATAMCPLYDKCPSQYRALKGLADQGICRLICISPGGLDRGAYPSFCLAVVLATIRRLIVGEVLKKVVGVDSVGLKLIGPLGSGHVIAPAKLHVLPQDGHKNTSLPLIKLKSHPNDGGG